MSGSFVLHLRVPVSAIRLLLSSLPRGQNMPVKSTFLTACDLSLHFHLIILFHEEQEGGKKRLFSVLDCAGETVVARGAVNRLAGQVVGRETSL